MHTINRQIHILPIYLICLKNCCMPRCTLHIFVYNVRKQSENATKFKRIDPFCWGGGGGGWLWWFSLFLCDSHATQRRTHSQTIRHAYFVSRRNGGVIITIENDMMMIMMSSSRSYHDHRHHHRVTKTQKHRQHHTRLSSSLASSLFFLHNKNSERYFAYICIHYRMIWCAGWIPTKTNQLEEMDGQ